MIRKSSTEVKNIFDMDRHELDRYRKSGIISTVEEVGQGQSKGCISIDLEGLLEKDEFDGIDSISKFDCTVSVEDRDYNELTSGTLSADGINYKKGNK
ncbi:MAG: hypothetical protein SPK77_05190 [Lachnospiraceae bacterium]|nr:hypothetical protein [Lachnospiraceae bacterium]